MNTQAVHPDHLKPGDMVGPWRIVESLGSGNFGHAFKVECEGDFFTMKMAVRPAPDLSQTPSEKLLEERQVDARMSHEGAILMANTSHPGLPHLRGVGRWPHPKWGYQFFVTDYVTGEPFHTWRERARPTAAQLVDLFIEVVRVVARLHGHGIFIRDFKSEHVIVPEDLKPVLVDLGSAWLPGGSTLTVGLAPATPHALPPECVSFIRKGTWKQGARFSANEAGDLYQLGVFMYEALTDGWPFDPRFTTEELLTAIETVVPRAPHRINPEVPEPLSRITQRLLEKRPEDRYPSAEALLQALWDAAKERSKQSWKVPLELPAAGPAPMTQDEVEERRLHKLEAERRAQEAQQQRAQERSRDEKLEQFSVAFREMEAELAAMEAQEARRKHRRRRLALWGGAPLLILALLTASWMWLAPVILSPAELEKGSSPVSTLRRSTALRAAAAWMCATLSIGCSAPQLRPVPGDCPPEAVRRMTELNILVPGFAVVLDHRDPDGTPVDDATFRPGPIISRYAEDMTKPSVGHRLPDGTLFYGQLWTEGITLGGVEAAYVRYTEAVLPDGTRFPVCMVWSEPYALRVKSPGSKPGEARLPRALYLEGVEYWP